MAYPVQDQRHGRVLNRTVLKLIEILSTSAVIMEISEVDTDNESAPVFKIALNKSSPAHTNQNLNQRHVSDVNKSSPSHQNSDRKSMAAAKKWGTKSGESTDPSPGANGNKVGSNLQF